jgi:hypothetical protein
MRRMLALSAAAALGAIAGSGCSWQQAYSSAQGWQRNTCYRLVDQTERDRCLGNAGMPYDDYRRRTGDGVSSSGPSKQ